MGNAASKKKRRGSTGNSFHDNLVLADKQQVDKNYTLDGKQDLGKGTSTTIKQGTSKKYTKTARSQGVAIKLYDGKSEIPPDLKQEAEILSKCDHPNICKLYEVAKTGKSTSLVLELCRGGCVMDKVKRIDEDEAARIMKQITSAGKQKCHITTQMCQCSHVTQRL